MGEIAKITSRIEKALMVPEVSNNLTDIENRICRLKSGIKINELGEKQFVEIAGLTAAGISSMVGLKSVDADQVYNFQNFLKNYYSSLTIEELNAAFELALVGELDPFLPKDKNGQPDRNHYQNFSMDYVTKILNAYKKKLSQTVVKAYKLLPPPEHRISEQQQKANENFLIQDLKDKFEMYKEKGMFPYFIVNHAVNIQLQKIGVITEIPEPREDAIAIAFKNVTNGIERMDQYAKKRLISDKEKEINNFELKARAYKYETHQVVKEWFDKIISEGKTIDEYFNNDL